MYDGLKHAHSGLRWVVLLLLLAAIGNAFMKWRGGKTEFTGGDKKLALFALISVHLQLVIGLALYFMGPYFAALTVDAGAVMKNSGLRFFAVEHISVMIIGIILITIGYSKAKRTEDINKRFKTTFIFYLIGLILILARVPWPGMYGTGWG